MRFHSVELIEFTETLKPQQFDFIHETNIKVKQLQLSSHNIVHERPTLVSVVPIQLVFFMHQIFQINLLNSGYLPRKQYTTLLN